MDFLLSLRGIARGSWKLNSQEIVCAGHDSSESESLLSGDPLNHYLIQGIGDVQNIGERRKWLYRPLLTMLSRCAALADTIASSDCTILVGRKCLLCIQKAIVECQIRSGWHSSGNSVAEASFILESVDCFTEANTNP